MLKRILILIAQFFAVLLVMIAVTLGYIVYRDGFDALHAPQFHGELDQIARVCLALTTLLFVVIVSYRVTRATLLSWHDPRSDN